LCATVSGMDMVKLKQKTIFETWGVPASGGLGNYNLGFGYRKPKKPFKIQKKNSNLKKNKITKIRNTNYLKYFGLNLNNKQVASERESTWIGGPSMVSSKTNGGWREVGLHGLEN
jgi:hypothetical protein